MLFWNLFWIFFKVIFWFSLWFCVMEIFFNFLNVCEWRIWKWDLGEDLWVWLFGVWRVNEEVFLLDLIIGEVRCVKDNCNLGVFIVLRFCWILVIEFSVVRFCFVLLLCVLMCVLIICFSSFWFFVVIVLLEMRILFSDLFFLSI